MGCIAAREREKKRSTKSLWTKQLSVSERVCGPLEIVFGKLVTRGVARGPQQTSQCQWGGATFWPDSTVVVRQPPLTSSLSIKTTEWKSGIFLHSCETVRSFLHFYYQTSRISVWFMVRSRLKAESLYLYNTRDNIWSCSWNSKVKQCVKFRVELHLAAHAR